ncbi:hypothetical protein ABEB22_00235 [Thioclava sp. 'Guangxiensis']|uniref:hypothetical protein n=1 Tax=Thioclava sp. 'Guangxiensis' TaxID=3149044 RepID=UPI0038779DEA
MASPSAELEETLCTSLRTSLPAGPDPGFLTSWPEQPNRGAGVSQPDPALRDAGFVYDNALAVIALLGCGDLPSAQRIGAAFLQAQEADRSYRDGRLRNAYRAGLSARPALPPGYWSDKEGRWIEDAYQVGTTSGNMAWVGLAYLHLSAASHDPKWRAAALGLAYWIDDHMRPDNGMKRGYLGGYFGFEPDPARAPWSSTEHNLDIVALSRALMASTPPLPPDDGARLERIEATAREMVLKMWRPARGAFLTGTTPEGQPSENGGTMLDVQVWPYLALPELGRISGRPATVADILKGLTVTRNGRNGLDFNDDRDGIWAEGTAQAALTLNRLGLTAQATEFMITLSTLVDPATGYLLATDGTTLSTGLSIGIGSSGEIAFTYPPRPHLGATAWALLALQDRNPFIPAPLPLSQDPSPEPLQ